MKKPEINQNELEEDVNKLKEQAESFDQILKTKYKDYLDDQE